MSAKLTQDEFLRRAKEIYGQKYDYSQSKYKRWDSKVKVKCLKHAIFEVHAYNHIKLKQGCPVCSRISKRLKTRKLILKGERFGEFITTGVYRDNKRGQAQSEVKCRHGVKHFINNNSLRFGGSKSCMQWKECAVPSAGTVFSKLIVLSKRKYVNNKAQVLVRCSHGNTNWLKASLLKQGKTTSCMRWKVCEGLNRYLDNNGYFLVTVNGEQVREHRYLLEKKLGRDLREDEIVHHKNGNRQDNRLRNLELWTKNHGAGVRIFDLRDYLKTIPKSLGGLK